MQLAPGVMGATLNVFAVQFVQALFAVAVQLVEDVPDGHTAQAVHGADPLTLKVEPVTHSWPRASGSAAASSSTHDSREVEVIVESVVRKRRKFVFVLMKRPRFSDKYSPSSEFLRYHFP